MSPAGRQPPGPAAPDRPPWWAALPQATAEVPCGGQTHLLRWAEGKLTADDHPDAEGELVLAALGGERPECLGLVEAWGRHSDDLEVLAVGPRSAADELTIGPDDVAGLTAFGGPAGRAPMAGVMAARVRGRPAFAWTRLPPWGPVLGAPRIRPLRTRPMRLATGGTRSTVFRFAPAPVTATLRPRRPQRIGQDAAEPASARRAELLSLLALGRAFQWRLAGTVAAAWADGGGRASGRDAGRPALAAALTGRLAPAAQAWLGIDPGRVEASPHEDAGWGRLALSGDGPGRTLLAALPAAWLASVWAAGLAVTAGHLIVAVTAAAWPGATVLGVPEPGADPVTLDVHAVARNGEVTWVR